MLQINGISKQFGSKVLFEDADAFVGNRSRIALIGANGTGKSTLIKMIMGLEEPDAGAIHRTSKLAIGYLPQDLPRAEERTVLGETMRIDGRRDDLLALRGDLELKFTKQEPSEAELERYSRVMEELEHLDEYRLESRAKAILLGMGFQETDYQRSLTEFSGGWLMRVALSRILLLSPDLLLLDEPTNHLDLESQLWLEEFLAGYPGALVLISHDSAFLNRMVNEVFEIDQKKIFSYKGNLDSYAVQKEERLRVLEAQYESQQSKVAEIRAFVARFGAKATKARQAQSRLKQLEKMDLIELPQARSEVKFRFPPAPHSGKDVIRMEDTGLAYGDKRIFRKLNWTITRGSRTAIVGVNGAGKTSLLKLLAEKIAPTDGMVKIGHEVKTGFYAQMQAESLDPKKTILQELEDTAPNMPIAQVRGVAGAFLFSGDAVEKRCGVLSGGEKARVALAKLLLSPANFLILDEPTNHLDVESRGVLLDALSEYTGTLCLVSHDRDFMRTLVDSVLEIIPGPGGSQVHHLVSTYDEYLTRKMSEASTQLRTNKEKTDKKPADKIDDGKNKTPSNNKVQAWRKESDKLEAEIAKLEMEQAEIHEKLSGQGVYDDQELLRGLLARQGAIQKDLTQKMERWEELALQLESVSK